MCTHLCILCHRGIICVIQHWWNNGFDYIWLSETLTNSEQLKDCQSLHPKNDFGSGVV